MPGTDRSHDGIPRGGEDVSVVVALIMSFQLLGEVLSGQLESKSTSQPHHKYRKSKRVFVLVGHFTDLTLQSVFSAPACERTPS